MNNGKQVETEKKRRGRITDKVHGKAEQFEQLSNRKNTHADVLTCNHGYQMICINIYMAYEDQL